MVTGPPAATPVTTPLPFTDARAGMLLAHVTVRPVSTLPLASLVVAINFTVCPTCTVAVAGDTVTEATGTGLTVMAAVPLWPSLVAVMMTGPPTATPVTRPLPFTVARAGELLAHATGRSVSVFALKTVAEG